MRTLLFAWIALVFWTAIGAESRESVNIGTTANDGTGDTLRASMIKLNTNDFKLWREVFTNGVGRISGTNIINGISYVWPADNGDPNEVLLTDGSGLLTWSVVPLAGGGTGATNASAARAALGLGEWTTNAQFGLDSGTYAAKFSTNANGPALALSSSGGGPYYIISGGQSGEPAIQDASGAAFANADWSDLSPVVTVGGLSNLVGSASAYTRTLTPLTSQSDWQTALGVIPGGSGIATSATVAGLAALTNTLVTVTDTNSGGMFVLQTPAKWEMGVVGTRDIVSNGAYYRSRPEVFAILSAGTGYSTGAATFVDSTGTNVVNVSVAQSGGLVTSATYTGPGKLFNTATNTVYTLLQGGSGNNATLRVAAFREVTRYVSGGTLNGSAEPATVIITSVTNGQIDQVRGALGGNYSVFPGSSYDNYRSTVTLSTAPSSAVPLKLFCDGVSVTATLCFNTSLAKPSVLENGDYVVISGATPSAFNGTFMVYGASASLTNHSVYSLDLLSNPGLVTASGYTVAINETAASLRQFVNGRGGMAMEGSTAGSWYVRLSQTPKINVRWFDAKGDCDATAVNTLAGITGYTDDWPAIQAAASAMNVGNMMRAVQIPGGAYRMSRPLQLPCNRVYDYAKAELSGDSTKTAVLLFHSLKSDGPTLVPQRYWTRHYANNAQQVISLYRRFYLHDFSAKSAVWTTPEDCTDRWFLDVQGNWWGSTIERCEISTFRATSGTTSGGAIRANSGFDLVLRDNFITGNHIALDLGTERSQRWEPGASSMADTFLNTLYLANNAIADNLHTNFVVRIRAQQQVVLDGGLNSSSTGNQASFQFIDCAPVNVKGQYFEGQTIGRPVLVFQNCAPGVVENNHITMYTGGIGIAIGATPNQAGAMRLNNNTITWNGADTPKSVTLLTNATGVAWASVVSHGYKSGQKVTIAGASPSEYNGEFHVIVVDTSTFKYQMASDPGMDASGTITATSTTSPVQVGLTSTELSIYDLTWSGALTEGRCAGLWMENNNVSAAKPYRMVGLQTAIPMRLEHRGHRYLIGSDDAVKWHEGLAVDSLASPSFALGTPLILGLTNDNYSVVAGTTIPSTRSYVRLAAGANVTMSATPLISTNYTRKGQILILHAPSTNTGIVTIPSDSAKSTSFPRNIVLNPGGAEILVYSDAGGAGKWTTLNPSIGSVSNLFAGLVYATNGITIQTNASTATPAAGSAAIYAKADGKVYSKDDLGTEYDLTSSGGFDPTIDVYTTPGNHLWTRPTGTKAVTVYAVAGGAGGGGGYWMTNSGTAIFGGGGGGGGAYAFGTMTAAQSVSGGSTNTVVVGSGGAGGAGGFATPTGSSGAGGGSGGLSRFGVNVIANGGNQGLGGSTTSGSGGSTIGGSWVGESSSGVSGTGASSAHSSNPSAAFNSVGTAAGGGAGGGIAAAGTLRNGSAGGAQYGQGLGPGIAGGVGAAAASNATPTTPTTPTSVTADYPCGGAGGGGGGATFADTVASTGGAGGDASLYGGGGGGGGAATGAATTAGGAGGAGASGIVVVISWK